jgi:hypothetical protein
MPRPGFIASNGQAEILTEFLPALLPVIGLAFLVLLHVAFVWIGVFGRHLGPLVASAVVYWIAVGALALNIMSAGQTDDRLPLAVLSVLSSIALSYCYFTFVNLTATSLRIRLLRLLVNDSELGRQPERLLQGYSVADIVDVRMSRLQSWGHAKPNGDRLVMSQKPLFYWLGKIVRFARFVLGVKNEF